MATKPRDEDIDTLVAMGICSGRDEAARRLKAHSNDLQQAVNAYFENPSANPFDVTQDPMSTNWDEAQFHTDKTDYTDQGLASFSIHPSDNLRPNVFGAPSRPPSRVQDRPIDLTKEHTTVDASTNMSAENREEADLRRAVELSMSDIRTQETGVTGATAENASFGPANRPYYDPSKWALTLTAQEIIIDPDPADRQRDHKEPAILRPSVSADHISSLLTILHAIPMAREALLVRDALLGDYGHDKDWWKGSEIKVPRVINTAATERSPVQDALVNETQRLMAFLDQTDRSYGSVEVLANLDPVKDGKDVMSVMAFLNYWQEAVKSISPTSPLTSMFESTGIKASTDDDEEARSESFHVLNVLMSNDVAKPENTLYDALDDLIWAENQLSDEATVYLDGIGEVFTIFLKNLSSDQPRRQIQVPSVWYPDRYLKAAKDQAREMRSKQVEIKRHIEHIEKKQLFYTHWKTPEGHEVDPRQLMLSAIKCINTVAEAHRDDPARKPGGSTYSSKQNTIAELQSRVDIVNMRLEKLEKEKKRCLEIMKEISTLLTDPQSDTGPKPEHPYTLRGIATDPHITYLLYPTDDDDQLPSLSGLIAKSPSKAGRNYQWWRISTSSNDSQPVQRAKVDEDLVLQAASDEGSAALLIYASAHEGGAMDFERWANALPTALHNFVRADNLAFSAELSAATAASTTASSSPAQSGSHSAPTLTLPPPPPFPPPSQTAYEMFDPVPEVLDESNQGEANQSQAIKPREAIDLTSPSPPLRPSIPIATRPSPKRKTLASSPSVSPPSSSSPSTIAAETQPLPPPSLTTSPDEGRRWRGGAGAGNEDGSGWGGDGAGDSPMTEREGGGEAGRLLAAGAILGGGSIEFVELNGGAGGAGGKRDKGER